MKTTKTQSVYRLRKLRAFMRRVPDRNINMRHAFSEPGEPGCMLCHAERLRFFPADTTEVRYLGVTERQFEKLYLKWFDEGTPFVGAAGKAEFDRRISKLIALKAA